MPAAYREDIIPDGHHEVIFHLQPGAGLRKDGNNGWTQEPVSFIAGQTLQAYWVELKPGSVLYGIRLFPHTLSLLFSIPASLVTNTILPLDDAATMKGLGSCVDEDKAVTFGRFEKMIYRQIAARQPVARSYAYVDRSVRYIFEQQGNTTIDTLLRKTGISGRHLDKLFQQYVGINPKKLAGIIRLNYFINYVQTHPHHSLTQSAYEAGFCDQSHLIRLFKQVIGQTPGKYFRAQANTISSYFSGL